jgi:alpha-N-arabinofuranosidase
MYATNKGTDLISITNNGKPITGQNHLYATAAKDLDKKEVIIKLVNISNTNQKVTINLSGKRVSSRGTMTVLTSDSLVDKNSFETPDKISPKESAFKLKGKKAIVDLQANSFVILKFKLI